MVYASYDWGSRTRRTHKASLPAVREKRGKESEYTSEVATVPAREETEKGQLQRTASHIELGNAKEQALRRNYTHALKKYRSHAGRTKERNIGSEM